MKRLERLAQVTSRDGILLELRRHDGDYSLSANGAELMSTRRHHSEEVLADVACTPLRETSRARVLIGGLGLGFTLRAALRSLGPDASVVVVELVPEVIDWNMNPDYDLARTSLLDPRVELRQADVARTIRESAAAFDAIMLDVDNGAAALTSAANLSLYRDDGIHQAMAALRPGGRLAYWSADADADFLRALRRCGLEVETITAPRSATSRRTHAIYLACLPGASRRKPASPEVESGRSG